MTSPLLERHPALAALPLAGIADLPTPVETIVLAGIGAPGGPRELAVKRDDLTSPSYGGNKVRKLDLLFGEALAAGRRAVLTFGAYGSNHALATAVHGRALGLEPHAVLSPQAPTPYARATLLAHAGIGTVIHPVEGWDGAREAVRAKQALAERDGVEPYLIPMGGTNALGALAYVSAALELAEWPDRLYVAAGTLGTAVGIAVGLAIAGAPTRVEAVRVTPERICSPAIAERIVQETVALARSVDPGFPRLSLPDCRLTLREDFYEPGYGVPTPEASEAVSLAAAAGVTLETTYTGRALAALVADARAGKLAGERVLFWDTYSSAPMPPAGEAAALPNVLREYVEECDRLFGGNG